MSVWIRKILLGKETPLVLPCCQVDGGDVYHVEETNELLQDHGDKAVDTCFVFDANESFARIVEKVESSGKGKSIVILAKRGSLNDAKAFLYIPYHETSSSSQWTPLKVEFTPGFDHLFSRNQGLVVAKKLKNRTVALVGLDGLFVSAILELAKAGVGGFIIIGDDRVQGQDTFCHPWDGRDLGRSKVNALKDLLKSRNPLVRITAINRNPESIAETLDSILVGNGCDMIILGSMRSREFMLKINDVAIQLRLPIVAGRYLENGACGDVAKANSAGGPCLRCIYDSPTFTSGQFHPTTAFASSLTASTLSQMAAKVALLQLSVMDLSKEEMEETGAQRLLNDLSGNLYGYYGCCPSDGSHFVPLAKSTTFIKTTTDTTGTWLEKDAQVVQALINTLAESDALEVAETTFDRKLGKFLLSFRTREGHWVIRLGDDYASTMKATLHARFYETQAEVPVQIPESDADISPYLLKLISAEPLLSMSTGFFDMKICKWFPIPTPKCCDRCKLIA